jgi:hypothetical protein
MLAGVDADSGSFVVELNTGVAQPARPPTVPAKIKEIAAKMSGKGRFMPSLTYDATPPQVIVVGNNIRRRILGGVNQA